MDRLTDSAGITLVCCGLIGTLVVDDGLIERSFAEAIATQGVVSGTSAFARRMSQVHQARGLAPGDVLRVLFPDNEPRAQAALLAFERALPEALSRTVVQPIPDAIEALAAIRASGRQICVVSSLPRRVVDLVLSGTDLRGHIDLALSGDDAPRGFPAPDLALTAVIQSGAGSVQNVAVVHGTGAGMECGRRSGASAMVGVLTGPHSAARLRGAGATHVISSIADLPGLLKGLGGDSVRVAATAENGASSAGPARRGAAASASPARDVPSQVGAQRRLQS
jgi:phosphonatase-like hydrolase